MKKETLETQESPKKNKRQKSVEILKKEIFAGEEEKSPSKQETIPSTIEKVRSEIQKELNDNKDKELNELKEIRRDLMNRIDVAGIEYELSAKRESTVVGLFNRMFRKEKERPMNEGMKGEINFLNNELEKVDIDISELEKTK